MANAKADIFSITFGESALSWKDICGCHQLQSVAFTVGDYVKLRRPIKEALAHAAHLLLRGGSVEDVEGIDLCGPRRHDSSDREVEPELV